MAKKMYEEKTELFLTELKAAFPDLDFSLEKNKREKYNVILETTYCHLEILLSDTQLEISNDGIEYYINNVSDAIAFINKQKETYHKNNIDGFYQKTYVQRAEEVYTLLKKTFPNVEIIYKDLTKGNAKHCQIEIPEYKFKLNSNQRFLTYTLNDEKVATWVTEYITIIDDIAFANNLI